MQDDGDLTLPVPKQGPLLAINVGHDSTVPRKDSQGYRGTHPKEPPHTQLTNPFVGGYQLEQSPLLLAVVFKTHVLSMHASLEIAV